MCVVGLDCVYSEILFRRFVTFAAILLLLVGASCRPKHPLSERERFESYFPTMPRTELPQAVLDRIPSLLGSLKPGMTPKQVYKTLGLAGPVGLTGCDGPWRRYRFGHEFRTNQFMVLQFNMLTQPPSFVEARLYGEGWQKSR